MSRSRLTHLDHVDSFDPSRLKIIERAIERAWDVIRHTGHPTPKVEDRSLLAICVMNEARSGEENHIVLVNRAINQFRQQRLEHATLREQNERRG